MQPYTDLKLSITNLVYKYFLIKKMHIFFNYLKTLKFNKIIAITGLIVSVISLLGVIFMLDKRWAYKEDLLKLEQKLEYKICIDQRNGIQYRIWHLEDRYKHINKMDQLAKEEYRQLYRQLKDLQCNHPISISPS